MSAREAVLRLQHSLERELKGATPDKVAAFKAMVQAAVSRAAPGARVDSVIQEARTEMQQYSVWETETQAKSQDKQTGLSAASKYLSAAADTISKAAVGGEEIPNMVEEDEAKANAAQILQPLYGLLDASQLESGPGHSGAGPEVGKQMEGSARQAREAQMDDLKHKTGDVLYPSAGAEEPADPQPGDSSWNSKPAEL